MVGNDLNGKGAIATTDEFDEADNAGPIAKATTDNEEHGAIGVDRNASGAVTEEEDSVAALRKGVNTWRSGMFEAVDEAATNDETIAGLDSDSDADNADASGRVIILGVSADAEETNAARDGPITAGSVEELEVAPSVGIERINCR
jgi:hypothetical protein